MLRVKIDLKYITPIYFKWGETKIIYESLDLNRLKDLNKLIVKNSDDVA
jgi:hypothetical protein